MHATSYLKARVFVEEYLPAEPGRVRQVLEIGSKSYHAQDTYRPLFDGPDFAYRGLDIEAGPNVDIVPKNPFVWEEIADESFDVCISGQTFEHNPYFWVTFAEMARVLRPGGLAFVVAPGGGKVHRYPVDCWRFYPDSWAALCTMAGMELVESYFEPDRHLWRTRDARWRDSAAIARKPDAENLARPDFYSQLGRIVSAWKEAPVAVPTQLPAPGRWTRRYEAEAQKSFPRTILSAVQRLIASGRLGV